MSCALSSLYLKSMHLLSCWGVLKNVIGGVIALFLQNVIGGVYYVSWFNMVKLSPEFNWYHTRLKESRTLYAYDNWCNVSYLTIWICDNVHRWNVVNVVNMWKGWICTCCFIMLVRLMINVDMKFIVNDLFKCLLFIWKWICCFTFIWLYIICGI